MYSFGRIEFGIKHVLWFNHVTSPMSKGCVLEGKIHRSTARSPALDEGASMRQLLSAICTQLLKVCSIRFLTALPLDCLV